MIILTIALLTGCAKNWEEQYNLGMRYLEEGKYQEAIIAFTEAVEIDDKQPLPYVDRGDAYILLDESFEEAKVDYEKALELDDTTVGAYLGMAEICIRQDRLDDAIAILEKGLEKTGDDDSLTVKIEEIQNLIANGISPENQTDTTEADKTDDEQTEKKMSVKPSGDSKNDNIVIKDSDADGYETGLVRETGRSGLIKSAGKYFWLSKSGNTLSFNCSESKTGE